MTVVDQYNQRAQQKKQEQDESVTLSPAGEEHVHASQQE